MPIKGARSIAEYAITKWLQNENFVISEFDLLMNGNEGTVRDKTGDAIVLVYDSDKKTVSVKE